MAEGSGVATIIVIVTQMRIITITSKSQENSRMFERRGVVTITAMIIKMRNVTRRKIGSKCKDSSTVDDKNSEKYEISVKDSTTADCNTKPCCCNGKIES